MKNDYSVNFYKAYTLWKTTLKDDANYKGYIKSLNNKTSGDNALSGAIGSKLLDLSWVEKVEFTLPYLDNAIREARSFIEQKDEIVSIEKVKRVNTQSIRHLAQHTNMIAKVEDNGDVLPNRILNIYYESNVAIYENRFLYTLLQKLVTFVEKRYQALKNAEEKIDINFEINKQVKRKDKIAKMTLSFDYKTEPSLKYDLNQDTSQLSGFVRVMRIRSILSDFLTITLIKDLVGSEPVTPPIINTNLMSKNVNFRTCKELYEFIERYRGEGYTYKDKVFNGKMPKAIKDDLADVFVFTNFLSEITFNKEFQRRIKKNYYDQLAEEKKEAKQRELEEEQRRREQTQELVNKTVERKTSPLLKKIDLLEIRNQKLNFKHNLLKQQHEMMLETVNGVMRQHRLIEQEQLSVKSMEENIRELEEQINLKNQKIIEARSTLNKAEYPITIELAEKQMQARKEEQIKEQMIKFQQQKEQEIKEQIIKFQEQKEQEIKEQVQKFNEQKQEEMRSLVMNFHKFEEPKIIKFPTLKFEEEKEQEFDEKSQEEQELEELIKRLEEEAMDEPKIIKFSELQEEQDMEDEQQAEEAKLITEAK